MQRNYPFFLDSETRLPVFERFLPGIACRSRSPLPHHFHKTKPTMKILFISRRNAGVLPVSAALLLALFINPALGPAQHLYTLGGAGNNHGLGSSEMTNIVDQLEHNALLALLGVVVLLVILYICLVLKACTGLNLIQKNTHNLLLLVLGLSSFCSSCSVEQQAMAAQYRASEAAKHRNYESTCQHGNYSNIPFINRYPSIGYSNWPSPSFCRYCGQRVFNTR